MKKMIFSLLILVSTQSAIAELRTFQCKFVDNKGRQVTAILNVDGDDIEKQTFMGLLSFKIDDFTFPSVPAKIHNLVIKEGKIESVQARHDDGAKRAYMDGSQATAQFDLTEALSGGKVLPATCGEL